MHFHHRIRYRGKEYTVSIDWNVMTTVSRNLTFEITGMAADAGGGKPEEIKLTVEARADDRVIVISHDRQEIAQIPLDLEFTGESLDGTDLDAEDEEAEIWGKADLSGSAEEDFGEEMERFGNTVRNVLDPEDLEVVTAELIIQAIPTDPLLGCLLKSAASTLIGQLTRCWRTRELDAEGARLAIPERVLRIGECVRDQATAMGWRFMWRAGRCCLFAGLA